MGTTIDSLGLQEMTAATEGRHIIFNEAINKIISLVQGGAIDYTATPPGTPAEGDLYLVGGSATAVWAGHDQEVALYYGASWKFFTPEEGWRLWLEDENTYRRYDAGGDIWVLDNPYDIYRTLTSGDTVNIDWSLGGKCKLTLDRASTALNMSGAVDGQLCRLLLIEDATGSRAITDGGSNILGGTDTPFPPTLSGANKRDLLAFWYDSTLNKYLHTAISKGF